MVGNDAVYEVWEVHFSDKLGMVILFDEKDAIEYAIQNCEQGAEWEVLKGEAYLSNYDLDELEVNGYVWR